MKRATILLLSAAAVGLASGTAQAHGGRTYRCPTRVVHAEFGEEETRVIYSHLTAVVPVGARLLRGVQHYRWRFACEGAFSVANEVDPISGSWHLRFTTPAGEHGSCGEPRSIAAGERYVCSFQGAHITFIALQRSCVAEGCPLESEEPAR
jgi:hypothetical protein